MVRFIILEENGNRHAEDVIYIPLWLDLLLIIIYIKLKVKIYLHSTMVRFIMSTDERGWDRRIDLHSTMVRFII